MWIQEGFTVEPPRMVRGRIFSEIIRIQAQKSELQAKSLSCGPKLRITAGADPQNPNRITQLYTKHPLKPSWIHLKHRRFSQVPLVNPLVFTLQTRGRSDVGFQLQPTPRESSAASDPPSQGVNFESFFGRFRVDFESIACRDLKSTQNQLENDRKATRRWLPERGGRWWGDESWGLAVAEDLRHYPSLHTVD